MKNHFILLGVFLMFFGKAQSQDRWSLQSCIQTAHRNSPIVQQNRLAAEQSQNQLMQSRVALLPSVDRKSVV